MLQSEKATNGLEEFARKFFLFSVIIVDNYSVLYCPKIGAYGHDIQQDRLGGWYGLCQFGIAVRHYRHELAAAGFFGKAPSKSRVGVVLISDTAGSLGTLSSITSTSLWHI